MHTQMFTEKRNSGSKQSASNLDQYLTSNTKGKVTQIMEGNKTMLVNSNSTKNVAEIGIRKLSGPANKTLSAANHNTVQSVASKQV